MDLPDREISPELTRTVDGPPKYQYQPLTGEDIRLLHLLPGHGDDEIHLCIVHVKLEAALTTSPAPRLSRTELQRTLPEKWRAFQTPEGRYFFDHAGEVCYYEHPNGIDANLYAAQPSAASTVEFDALSYVWGPPTRDLAVHVHSSIEQGISSTCSILKIGNSLEVALKALRYARQPRVMWIDAICIDQGSVDERGKQVARMGQIYSLARSVLVWLGPADPLITTAFGILQQLGERVEIADERWIFPLPSAKEPEPWRRDQQLDVTEEQHAAIMHLFSNGWFWRVWTFQEVMLAKEATFRRGDAEIGYYHLRRAMATLAHRERLPPGYRPLSKLLYTSFGLRGYNLGRLISLARVRRCQDPRDKVYGILGVLGIGAGMEPSYRLSCAAVYADAFVHLCRQAHCLDLLASCRFTNRLPDAPSWVPDWRTEAIHPFGLAEGFLAASHSPAKFHHPESRTLDVSAVRCGIVHHSHAFLDGQDVVDRLQNTRPSSSSESRYPTGETQQEAWLQTIHLGRWRERFPESTKYPTMETRREMVFDLLAGRMVADGPRRQLDRALQHSSFVRLDSGYFSLAAGEARVGDLVCVVLGCHLPLVLRPTRDGRFTVLGPCYVHGLMDGEALLGHFPEQWTVEQYGYDGTWKTRFFNSITCAVATEDPRLGRLPSSWKQVERERSIADAKSPVWFRDESSGDVINYDPRLTSDALKAAGVQLETLSLV